MTSLLGFLDRLDRLSGKATPGPWRSPGDDAAYIAAASPDVVRALVRVAHWAGEIPPSERGFFLYDALADLERIAERSET